MKNQVYKRIASLVNTLIYCREKWEVVGDAKHEAIQKHEETIFLIIKEHLPSGSGIDAGVKIDLVKSNADKLVFEFGFHHMNDGGYYDGWTEHVLTVTPSLQSGLNLRISGKDRNQIKEYLYETFQYALTREVEW